MKIKINIIKTVHIFVLICKRFVMVDMYNIIYENASNCSPLLIYEKRPAEENLSAGLIKNPVKKTGGKI